MDLDGTENQQDRSPERSPEEQPTVRRDRASIAAQACQTCRTRKTKCDEVRPKCGLCQRLDVECAYRVPLPTKKDKTLVEILTGLRRLEQKFDTAFPDLSSRSSSSGAVAAASPSSSSTANARAISTVPRIDGSAGNSRTRPTRDGNYSSEEPFGNNRLTAAHRILAWPCIYRFLQNAHVALDDIHHILREGTPWFANLEIAKHMWSLPETTGNEKLGLKDPSYSTQTGGVESLSVYRIRHLVDVYFNSYNIIHPLLDRDVFEMEMLEPAIRCDFQSNSSQSCIVLHVLALAEMALDGPFETSGPTTAPSTPSSALANGPPDHPPGLTLFNEARGRFGIVMYECSLENVQIYLLQAIYYESCARHMDFWRASTAASMACHLFMRCPRLDWDSPNTDVSRRVYWLCVVNEDFYHLELDLPRTKISRFQDQVPLPLFRHFGEHADLLDPSTTVPYSWHFLALVTLRRLISRIHESLHSEGEKNRAESDGPYGGIPDHLVNELARQLEAWRTTLPESLRWSDEDMRARSNRDPHVWQAGSNAETVGQDTNRPGLLIITAHLRTRFYYARYLIFRPYIYKALHHPNSMTDFDIRNCAIALNSACMWPLVMKPCRHQKRLVPYLFTWTQHYMGILLLFRMTSEDDMLGRIAAANVDKYDMTVTAAAMLDWIKEMIPVCGIAQWSWKILEPLYTGFDARV